MAFDTYAERVAMVSCLNSPVPFALPEAAGSWSDEMAGVMLQMYPSSSLPEPPEAVLEEGGNSEHILVRLKMLRIIR